MENVPNDVNLTLIFSLGRPKETNSVKFSKRIRCYLPACNYSLHLPTQMMLILVFAANPQPQPQLGVLCRTSRSGCRDMIDLQWSGNSFKYGHAGGGNSKKPFDER